MRASSHPSVAAIACAQHGVVTRQQLLDAGISPRTVSRRVRSGEIVPVGVRTYRLASARPTRRAAVMAACLDRGAVASHRTALWLHGLMEEPATIEVTVVKGRPNRTRLADGTEVVVHTTTNLSPDDVTVVDAIPTMSVARGVLGAAALVPDDMTQDELVEVVATAIETGRASLTWLSWLLDHRRCRGRNGVTAMEKALAARSVLGPTDSWLERRFLAIVDDAGLPRPQVQARVPRADGAPARVDFLYPGVRAVIETLGYDFHRTPEHIEADTLRASDVQLEGFTVLQFTSRTMRRAPQEVVQRVARALDAGGRAAPSTRPSAPPTGSEGRSGHR